MAVSRRKWDESVALHVASASYDVPRFLRGASSLLRWEEEEVGDVRGQSLLHLQCHFGMDTLSWARRGARVTGVDYSAPAIEAARELCRRSGLPGRFVRSDIYSARRRLAGRFDVVYTGKGALCWLPDLRAWARVVAAYLPPGGRLFYLEDHPVAEIHEPDRRTGGLRRTASYFRRNPFRDDLAGTYAVASPRMRNTVSYSWLHPISEAVQALADAGLTIDSLTEFPYSYWRRYPAMHVDPRGFWHLDRDEGGLPLMYSLRATKLSE